jgi:hypothetical protein
MPSQDDEKGLLSSQRISTGRASSAQGSSVGDSGKVLEEPRAQIARVVELQETFQPDRLLHTNNQKPRIIITTGSDTEPTVPPTDTPAPAQDDRGPTGFKDPVSDERQEHLKSGEIAAEHPLPASPPPASVTIVHKRYAQWSLTRRKALETAKATVITLERRTHAKNLRTQFLNAAQEFHTSMSLSEAVSDPRSSGYPTLETLRSLLESSLTAESEAQLADTLLAKTEHELAMLTGAIFEDEESAESHFDVLQAGDVDIKAAGEPSIASFYTDDAIDLETLDDTADQVARKIDQINMLEDLFTRIRSEAESFVADSDDLVAIELQDRGRAVQREITIAYAEREQLRAMPETPLDLDAILGFDPPDQMFLFG